MGKIYFFFILIIINIIPNISINANTNSINPFIDSLKPRQNAINISRTSNINIYFAQQMNSSTITTNNIRVFGQQTGIINCNINYNSTNKLATLTPSTSFKPGEIISISLTSLVKTSGNISITPFVYSFTASSAAAPGTFSQLSTVSAGNAPECAMPADLNNDGKIDLAVTNLNSSSVSYLKNGGTGYFTNEQTIATGSTPRLVVEGDFDVDGDMDLAIINALGGSWNILANNGTGVFNLISTYNITSGGPFSITTADFDGDGDLDIAIANYTASNIYVYKNNGTGNFSYPDVYSAGNGPTCITAGDVNNDGNIDLAITEWNQNRISVFINNGNGIFTLNNSYSVGTNPHSINFSDIDSDSDLDILVANSNSQYFLVFKNSGSGSFTSFASIPTGSYSVHIITGDIDGDGDLDVAISNNQNGVSFYLNNGSGNYTLSSSTGITTGPRRISFADYTGDGIIDLAVPNTDLNNVIIFKNGIAPPTAPVLISPANGSTGLTLTPTFIWYSINNVTSYKIEISLTSGFSSILDSANVTTNQYTMAFGKLNPSTTYYWRVNATNSNGTGPYSSVWSFTTLSVPPAPTLISPANNSIGVSLTPTLYWGSISGITNYKVQVSLTSSFTSLIDSAVITNNYYVIPQGKFQYNTIYYWRVNATNSNGTGPWSAVWNFRTLITGINIISEIIPDEFKLYNNYPNPFNPVTHLKFDLPEKSFVSILVFDNLGREISSLVNCSLMPGSYEVSWNGSNYSSGVYFYKLKTDKFESIKRMILLK